MAPSSCSTPRPSTPPSPALGRRSGGPLCARPSPSTSCSSRRTHVGTPSAACATCACCSAAAAARSTTLPRVCRPPRRPSAGCPPSLPLPRPTSRLLSASVPPPCSSASARRRCCRPPPTCSCSPTAAPHCLRRAAPPPRRRRRAARSTLRCSACCGWPRRTARRAARRGPTRSRQRCGCRRPGSSRATRRSWFSRWRPTRGTAPPRCAAPPSPSSLRCSMPRRAAAAAALRASLPSRLLSAARPTWPTCSRRSRTRPRS
mmetsp:Transcript_15575/g.44732  ORF Transcript_15575/g.44732 Transcript_15575/m.44732 type:complete len:260 (-) Transcript_15575:338-1117(-)